MPSGQGRARRGASGPSPPRARGRTAPTGRASRARRAHRGRSPSSGQPGPPRAGAGSRTTRAWQARHGPHAPTLGRRLPARRVPAPPRGSGGKGHALPRRRTHACAATGLVGKRGTATQGQRPAGVEQRSGATPAPHARAGATWWQPGSRAGPVRRVSRPHHGGTSPRPRARPWRPARGVGRRREHALRRPGRTAGGLDPPGLAPPATGVPQGGLASPGLRPGTLQGVARQRRGAGPRCHGRQRPQGPGSRLAEALLSTGRPRAGRAQAGSPRGAPGRSARGRALAHAKPRRTPVADGVDCRGPPPAPGARPTLRPASPDKRARLCGDAPPAGAASTHAPAGHRRRPRHPGLRGGAPSPPHGASPRTVATVEQHRVPRLGQGASRWPPHTARGGSKAQDVRSEPGHPWGCFGPVRRPPGRGPDGRRCRASQGPRRRPTHMPGAAPPEASSLAARAGVRRAPASARSTPRRAPLEGTGGRVGRLPATSHSADRLAEPA